MISHGVAARHVCANCSTRLLSSLHIDVYTRVYVWTRASLRLGSIFLGGGSSLWRTVDSCGAVGWVVARTLSRLIFDVLLYDAKTIGAGRLAREIRESFRLCLCICMAERLLSVAVSCPQSTLLLYVIIQPRSPWSIHSLSYAAYLLGPFHGAIAVPSVRRCRCCRCCCGHRCAGGVRQ